MLAYRTLHLLPNQVLNCTIYFLISTRFNTKHEIYVIRRNKCIDELIKQLLVCLIVRALSDRNDFFFHKPTFPELI